MDKIVINGKFMAQSITGVQRYAREILLELDKLLTSEHDVEIFVPQGSKEIPQYKNIKVIFGGKFKASALWEQISLPMYIKKRNAICVNLCNSAPILTPHIVVVHDISFRVNPQFYSKKMRRWTSFVYFMIIKRIKKIITDSFFSKNEIIRAYNAEKDKISVIYCGWQHFNRITDDKKVCEKNNLKKGEYFFSMSSMTPNKNFKWIAENARMNPQITYVVSGGVNERVFGNAMNFEKPDNMKLLGYVSDEEAKGLMQNCKAFLFPTFYEGFGLPPLEALSTGAKAVVSDASCMREIYGDSVYYIDPNNPNINLDELLKNEVTSSCKTLDRYSWRKSAEELLKIINQLI